MAHQPLLHASGLWALVVSLMLLTTSCATVFNQSTQSVLFASPMLNTKFIIDGSDTLTNGESIRLRRKDEHRVQIISEGYETEEHLLVRRFSPATYLNALIAVPWLGTGIYLLTRKDPSSRFDEPKMPEAAIGWVMIWTTIAAPSAGVGVDWVSGKMAKFDDKQFYPLERLPQPLDPQTHHQVSIGDIRSKVARGDEVAAYYSQLRYKVTSVEWLSYMYVDFDAVKDSTIAYADRVGMYSEAPTSGYVVEASIQSVDYDIRAYGVDDHRTTCDLGVKWFLRSGNGDVIYNHTYKSEVSTETNGGVIPVERAVRYTMFQFMNDENFRTKLQKAESVPADE